MSALFPRRERMVWTAGFLLVAVLLVLTRFSSDDPDSALYADLSARLADGPVSRWIVPEWWGNWDSEGLFREHPAGVFLVPTLLAAVGVPGIQAAYIAGIGAGLASLMLIAWLVARTTTVCDGRAVLLCLQLIPLAFIFRIRANHEYPMLVCLLVALAGVDAVRRSWRWFWITPLALCAAVLVKAAFVAVPLLAIGWWLLTNPRRESGPIHRPIAALALAAVAIVVMAVAYDDAYVRMTGESFWAGYWARQMAPLSIGNDAAGEGTILHHLGFYGLRLLWHPAPWTLALLVALWTRRSAWASMTDGARRGLIFSVGFGLTTVLMLTPASRFAERYIFSANYILAAAGIVVALYLWPSLRAAIERLDARIPALPAVCWVLLMVLRLVLGPFLPRISG